MPDFFLLQTRRPIVTIYTSFLCRSSWTNVKKNINIKGILINNEEMKISQYADDTQILRERSGSVVECLTRDRAAAGSYLIGVTAWCP